MKHIRIPAVALLTMAASSLWAQEAVVDLHYQSGTTSSITLGASGGIYFTDNNMSIRSADGVVSAVDLDALSFMKFSETAVGIEEATHEPMLKAYPNPTSGSMMLTGIGQEPQQVVVYNVKGAQVWEQTMTEGDLLRLESLPEGIYIARCGNKSIKIVKQK